jgi:hypothetical protein
MKIDWLRVPERIRAPIPILALCILLPCAVAVFLLGSAPTVTEAGGCRAVYLTLGVVFAAATLGMIAVLVWLLVSHRQKILDNDQYLQHEFRNFRPEPTPASAAIHDDAARAETYKLHKGVFLTHSWRPSKVRGQVADVTIRLCQHRFGPLTDNSVMEVEYFLGPQFFGGKTVTKRDPQDGFRLNVNAYYPMLCVAEVRFSDSTPPLKLEHYCYFPKGRS